MVEKAYVKMKIVTFAIAIFSPPTKNEIYYTTVILFANIR
jgi:hypothetical protein